MTPPREAARRTGGTPGRRGLLPGLLLLASLTLAHPPPAAAMAAAGSEPTAPAINGVLDRAQASGFSGIVLVADRRALRYARVLAHPDTPPGTELTPATRWRWASVTKQVSAVIVAGLAREGRLALDDRVDRHLGPQVAGTPLATVTLRQLLQHTSGIHDPYAEDTPASPRAVTPGTTPRAAVPAGASRHLRQALGRCAGPARAAPGARFHYNNCDTQVLGAVVEAVTGQPFEAVVQQRIAVPLGLTTLRLASAAGDSDDITAWLAPGQRAPVPALAGYGAAGALVGSARELVAFNQALLGDTLLTPADKAVYWRGDPRWGQAALGVWAYAVPLPGCTGNVSLVERRGAIDGVQVRNLLAPDLDRTLVVFTNRGDVDFGEVWQGRGLTHDLLAAALCGR
ncbi:MAG: serine hydrolase domain-containing protein [Aquabacterium sp.]